MRCPKCGSENCQIITDMHTEGKDFSASKGCCGWLLAGPIGVLCGFCTDGKRTYTDSYWVCNSCGKKWKV
jgi:hypothetical protein